MIQSRQNLSIYSLFKGLFCFPFYWIIFWAWANFDIFCALPALSILVTVLRCRRIYCLSLKRCPLLPIHSITRGCESELKSLCCNLRQSQTKGKVPSERGTKKLKLNQPSSNCDVCSSWQTDILFCSWMWCNTEVNFQTTFKLSPKTKIIQLCCKYWGIVVVYGALDFIRQLGA